MRTYKGFTEDLKATYGNGIFQYEPGKTYREEKSKTRSTGFHAAEYLPDCIEKNIENCRIEIKMLKSYTTAYNPEAIVKKLEGKIEYAGRLMVEKPADKLDEIANNTAEDYIQAYTEAIELVKGGGNIEQPGI